MEKQPLPRCLTQRTPKRAHTRKHTQPLFLLLTQFSSGRSSPTANVLTEKHHKPRQHKQKTTKRADRNPHRRKDPKPNERNATQRNEERLDIHARRIFTLKRDCDRVRLREREREIAASRVVPDTPILVVASIPTSTRIGSSRHSHIPSFITRIRAIVLDTTPNTKEPSSSSSRPLSPPLLLSPFITTTTTTTTTMMQDIASMGIRLLQTPEYVLPPARTGGSDTVPPSNTTTPNTTEQYYEEGAQSIYEFVAYVSWYLVVILCCVVPTVCAYRRRRVLERRAARQNYLQTMAENGLLFMAASNQPESEEMQKARMAKIEAEIAKTTMVSHNHETLVYVRACVRAILFFYCCGGGVVHKLMSHCHYYHSYSSCHFFRL